MPQAKCPGCNRLVEVAAEHVGKLIQCAGCGKQFTPFPPVVKLARPRYYRDSEDDEEAGGVLSGINFQAIGRALIAVAWVTYLLASIVYLAVIGPPARVPEGRGELLLYTSVVGGVGIIWVVIGYCFTSAVDRILRAVFGL